LSGWQTRPDHDSLSALTKAPKSYRGIRAPAEVIQRSLSSYYCFSLHLKDVETIRAARGLVVSYESILEWGLRFGRLSANTLGRCQPRQGDKWH